MTTSLVQHLHAFVKDVELTEGEGATAIDVRTGGTSTESTVLGPFHQVESPPRALGDDIALDGTGTPCLVSGRVTGPDGEPLAGATVDVWQTNEDGFYDVQQPGVQPAGNLRGLFSTDDDGPGGGAAGRDRPVTTHVFVADSPRLDSDAAFGVEDSLVRDVPEVDDPARAAEAGLPNPFRTLTFDLPCCGATPSRGDLPR